MKFREDFRRARCEHHAQDIHLLIILARDTMLIGAPAHAQAPRFAAGAARKPHAMTCETNA